ncbi:MAG: hypothetical protein AABZ15_11605 [Nitrospirota bacterium]
MTKTRTNKKVLKALIDQDWEECTITELARRAGLSRIWTSNAIHGNTQSRSAREAIAKALGFSYEHLWQNNRAA